MKVEISVSDRCFQSKIFTFRKIRRKCNNCIFTCNENSSIWDIKLWCFRKIRFWSFWERTSRIFEPEIDFEIRSRIFLIKKYLSASFISSKLFFISKFRKISRNINHKMTIFRKKWKNYDFSLFLIFQLGEHCDLELI